MQQFNHSHYAMLLVNNPKAAKEYIAQFQTGEELIEKSDRKRMVKELKDMGIKVFSNYKDETVKKMYDEAKSLVTN